MTDYKNEAIKNQIIRILPVRIRQTLSSAIAGCFPAVHEIVLRTERPVCVYRNGEQYFLTENGCLTNISDSQRLVKLSYAELVECFNFACGHSVYSHLNEIKDGFVTINGGHRVGICGTAVISDEKVVNIRDISTISVRISREVIGCGKELANIIVNSGKGMLICGVPCSGKTTVLRDIGRLLSEEYLRRVCVVDSRSELGSVYKGVLQNDLGMCDVMNGYPRDVGVSQAIRIFSPEFLICDEIGSECDKEAITSGVNSGVKFIASMHAGNVEDLKCRKYFDDIMSAGAFDKIVFLGSRENPGKIMSMIESCDF